MPQHVRRLSPDRLQIRQGGGGMALFGLPFFAAGIFMLLSVLGVIPIQDAPDLSRAALGLMSIPFTAVGATLTFGRNWIDVDSSERRVLKQWGLLVPMYERAFSLDGYTAVTLGFVRGDSDTSDKFPIGLKAQAGPDLPLCSFTTYAESWECALEIARHLRVDVEDSTTDHPVRVPPDRADASPRLRSEPSSTELVARPPTARSEVTREAGQLRISIPTPRLHLLMLAFSVVPVGICVFVLPSAIEFFRRTNTPGPIGWVFAGLFAIGFGVLPLMTVVNGFLRSRRGATIVLVSRDGVRVLDRGAWRTRPVVSLDASDIVGLDFSTRDSAIAAASRATEQRILQSGRSTPDQIGPRTERCLAVIGRFVHSGGVTVKTRRHGLTTFGAGLEDDEIQYLYSVVRQALAS